MRRVLLILLLAGAAVALLLTAPSARANTLECKELPKLFTSFTVHHYTERALTTELRERTLTRFVRVVDPSRTLLLAPEVEEIRKRAGAVFADLFRGRCGDVEATLDRIVNRSATDLAIARELLDADYALDESVELVIDPEVRGWPKTEKDRRALIERQLHFQIASYLTGGLELPKAKEQLIHRYELSLKRAKERRDRKTGPELMARAFAGALDPHTSYFSTDDLANFQIQMRLSLEGIGAALRTDNGFIRIESLVPGGAAAESEKVQPGDKIIAVQQPGEEPVSTIDMALDDAVKLIRGPKGTRVTLTLLREGKQTKTLNVTLTRDKVDIADQAASIDYETRKVGDRTFTIAVLELPSFYGGDSKGRSSYEDVKKLVEEASSKKVDGLILDLSRNGGGLMQDAVRISGLFIDKGAIVGTKTTQEDLDVLADVDPRTQFAGPLGVLVSPVSASAAEILAGAIKAYRRAVVIGGPHTFGKGTVQVVVPLPSELGAMKVTTGMFFLPDGATTQLHGVEADVVVPSLMSGFEGGEDELDYALKPQSVPAFLSPSAKNGWVRFDPSWAKRLQNTSRERVAKNPDFDAIREAIAEAKRDRDTITIGELRAEGANGSDGEDLDENRFDAMHETFTDEAVDILIDLHALAGDKRTH